MPDSRNVVVQDTEQVEGAPNRILGALFASNRSLDVFGDALGGAIIGAILGYIFGLFFSPVALAKALGGLLGLTIRPAVQFWLPALIGATCFSVLAIANGIIARKKLSRREISLQQTAATLGGSFSSGTDFEEEKKLQGLFWKDASLRLYNVIRTQIQDIPFVVAELQVSWESETADRSRSHTDHYTIAHFEPDTLSFPEFALQPKQYLTSLLAGMIGISRIEFPAQPEFSRNYELTAVNAQNTRRLFNDRLLERLSRTQGLYIKSNWCNLVIYRSGTGYGPEQLNQFVRGAAEVFSLFEESLRHYKTSSEAKLSSRSNARALADQIPGPMGKVVRGKIVTRADVEAFLRQPLPRIIPATIFSSPGSSAEGMYSFFGIGFIFALYGAVFAALSWDKALLIEKSLFSNDVMGLVLSLFFLGLGSCIAFFAGRAYLRIKRALRYGQVIAAKIVKLDGSRMTVQFQAEGRTVIASCQIQGYAVQRAQQLVASSTPAVILSDPADPQRILYVDGLLNISPEYEAK